MAELKNSQFLSLTGLTSFWKGAKSYIDTKVGEKLDKTATINGQKFVEGAATITGENITVGGDGAAKEKNVATAIKELGAIKHVNSIGGFSGEATLKAATEVNGDVNLAISDKGEISATVYGINKGAYAADGTGLNVGAAGDNTYQNQTIAAAIDALDKAVKDAAAKAGVTSFGAQTGDITVRDSGKVSESDDATDAKVHVNLVMAGAELQASISGLKAGAVAADGTELNVGGLSGQYMDSSIQGAIADLDSRVNAEETAVQVDSFMGKTGNVVASNDESHNVVFNIVDGGEGDHTLQANVDLSGKVDKTTTVNTKALSGNIVLDGTDLLVGTGAKDKHTYASDKVADAVEQIDIRLTAEEGKAHVESIANKTGKFTLQNVAAAENTIQLTVSDGNEISATLNKISQAQVTDLTTALDAKATKTVALQDVTGTASGDASKVTITLTENRESQSEALTKTIELPVAAESTHGTITLGKVKELAAAAATSTYKVKGSCAYEDLKAKEGGAKEGDVWNITNVDGFDMGEGEEKKHYPAGTNVVWVAGEPGGHWDALGGTVDLTPYAKTAEIATTFASRTGAITLDEDASTACAVKFAMSGNELQGQVVGLSNGATTEFVEITDEELDALPGLTGLIIPKKQG